MSTNPTSVFTNGTDGFACYRIPSLVRLANGHLLALAEGRVENCGDHGGPIRIVARISADEGESWGSLITIARNVRLDGAEAVAQNPSPVVDLLDPEHSGKIIIMFNTTEFGERDIAAGQGIRRIHVIESYDHGITWENERDITAHVHRHRLFSAVAHRPADHDWRCTFPPVGHGIQLQGGADGSLPTRGRLVFATYVTIGDRTVFQGQVHLISSDDGGATWQSSALASPIGCNELMAVERANGDLLVNFRNYATPDFTAASGRGQCVFRFQPDGSFGPPEAFSTCQELPQAGGGLQGSIHRVGATPTGPIAYSGANHRQERRRMAIWLSNDDGETWPTHATIDPGPAAYSDLATLANGDLGLLYETGGDDGIVFRRVSLTEIRTGDQ